MQSEAQFLDAITQDIVTGGDGVTPTLIYADFLEPRLRERLPGSDMQYCELQEIPRLKGEIQQLCSAPIWERDEDRIDGLSNQLKDLLPRGGRYVCGTDSNSGCRAVYFNDENSLLPGMFINAFYETINEDITRVMTEALENYPFTSLQLGKTRNLLPTLLNAAYVTPTENPHRIRTAAEAAAQLTSLDLAKNVFSPDNQCLNNQLLTRLGDSKSLPNVRHLSLRNQRGVSDLLDIIATEPFFKQLFSLDLRGTLTLDNLYRNKYPRHTLYLPQLRTLNLAMNSLDCENLISTLKPSIEDSNNWDNMPQLETLLLGNNRLRHLGLCGFFKRWQSMRHVKTLDLSHNMLGEDPETRRYRNLPLLNRWLMPALETLKLDHNGLTDRDFEDLQQCNNLGGLKSLSLDEPALGMHFEAIGNCGHFNRLEHLRLGFFVDETTEPPEEILKPIAEWKHFPLLEHLELDHNYWNDDLIQESASEIDVTPLVERVGDPEYDNIFLPSIRKISVHDKEQEALLDEAIVARWERKKGASEAMDGDAPDSAAVVGEVRQDAARGKQA